MTTQHRFKALAIALAAFAMACADPTMPSRTLLPDAPSLATSVIAYPFPIADGSVQLCKTSNVVGAFDFDASGGGAVWGDPPLGPFIPLDTDPDITIDVPGETECVIIYQSRVGNTGGAETITITETTNANLTGIATIRYLDPIINAANNYLAGVHLNDSEAGSTATVKINHDMARRVTFTNFTPPVAAICDFITFGRLVVQVGGQKVVISGNAGGNNANGSIKNEFHIEANGVDNHVADAITYGPIPAAPLASSAFTNSRMVTGTAKNGVAVELRLWDGGEPGKGTDMVYVKLGTTVLLGPVFIDQGNMQYHSNCRGPG